MTAARADDGKYVRVYYRVTDDPKFETIYGDDHHLATWVRLLLVADGIWPVSPPIPRTARRASMTALVAAGLVDLMPQDCYRIHGLDAERDMRSHSGRNAAAKRWHSEGTPTRDADPLLVRERGREQAKDESEQGASASENDVLDGPLAYHEVTGRYPAPGGELHRWVSQLGRDYGATVFQEALATEHLRSPVMKDLIGRTEARLAKAADQARKRRLQNGGHGPKLVRTPEQEAEYQALRKRLAEGGTA